MPVVAGDLVAYASLNRPQDDASPSGGGIDVTMRATPPAVLSPPGVLVVASSSALDVQVATVLYRDVYGNLLTSTINLSGTTSATGNFVVQELCQFQLSAAASGTVNVSTPASGASIAVVPPTERGFTMLFINAKQAVSAQRFEKLFWRNNNAAASTLAGAGVTLTLDQGATMTFGLAAALGDTVLVGNRELAPPGVTFNGTLGTRLGVPGSSMPPGTAIGVWLRQAVTALTAGQQNSFTTKLDGTT